MLKRDPREPTNGRTSRIALIIVTVGTICCLIALGLTISEFHAYRVYLGRLEYGSRVSQSVMAPHTGLYRLVVEMNLPPGPAPNTMFDGSSFTYRIARNGEAPVKRRLVYGRDSMGGSISRDEGQLQLWDDDLDAGEVVQVDVSADRSGQSAQKLNGRLYWEIWHQESFPEDQAWLARVFVWSILAIGGLVAALVMLLRRGRVASTFRA